MGEAPELPDPTGLDLARDIANAISHSTPLPTPKRRQKPRDRAAQRRGSRGSADPQPLGEALEDVIAERGWTKQVSVHLLLGRWPELVGDTVAEHSRPEGFHERVLTVRTDSTAWATNLRLLAPAILARLNEQLGDGSVVRIVVKGPDAPTWKHGRRSVRDGRGPRDTYG